MISLTQKTSSIRQLSLSDTQSKIKVYQLTLQWTIADNNQTNLLYQQ